MQKARKNKSPFSTTAAAFEALESRQMMSVTVAPSGGNDTAALQNAINSAPAGSTVNLDAGTYHVSSTLNMNGHVLAGVAGQTTLQWTGGSNSFLRSSFRLEFRARNVHRQRCGHPTVRKRHPTSSSPTAIPSKTLGAHRHRLPGGQRQSPDHPQHAAEHRRLWNGPLFHQPGPRRLRSTPSLTSTRASTP